MREIRAEVLQLKRDGSFVHKGRVLSGKRVISPFPSPDGELLQLRELSAAVVYSPIIKPYIPTTRKFKVCLDGPGRDRGLRRSVSEAGLPTQSQVATQASFRISERWSVCPAPQALGKGGLSRWVEQDEITRNAGRVASDGYSGYLALEWAGRAGAPEAQSLDLTVHKHRRQLSAFLGQLSFERGTDTQRKICGVREALEAPVTPWVLSRESGLRMQAGDLGRFHLPHPVVLWGADLGGGQRRIIHPFWGSGWVKEQDATSLMAGVGQIVWDQGHFFLLDQATPEVGEVRKAWADMGECGDWKRMRIGEGLAGVVSCCPVVPVVLTPLRVSSDAPVGVGSPASGAPVFNVGVVESRDKRTPRQGTRERKSPRGREAASSRAYLLPSPVSLDGALVQESPQGVRWSLS